MNNILTRLREELQNNATEETRISGQRFFKGELKSYGVKAAVVHRISKEYGKELKTGSKTDIFALCDQLWQSGNLEESFVACNWAHSLRKQYVPEDFDVFAKWITNYVNNWASCDTLCNHTIGDFVMMYPEFLARLKEFARSENRWVKRAAAVSLIIPARRGLFLENVLAIADILLLDTDDMVQKGYGWMLKAASQAHQQEVFDYVVRNKAVMPRTALRYAIEKMPKEMKAVAMEK
jgi:3-methyladenine DNA glycosylase AlkD